MNILKNKIINEKNFISRLATKVFSVIITLQTKVFSFKKGGEKMLLTEDHARKVRRKRADLQIGKLELAKKLQITPPTLSKVEQGNYDAPRRIYESVINWLLEDV